MARPSQTDDVLLLAPSSSALAALPGAWRAASATDLQARLGCGDGRQTVVLGPHLDLAEVADLVARCRRLRPDVPVVLERHHVGASVVDAAAAAGVGEVVTVGDLGGLAAAVARTRGQAAEAAGRDARQREHPLPGRGRVTTVFSAKGGCGTTTFCTNLAAALAAGGRRSVVLVDLDLLLGDVAVVLHLFPTATVADAAAVRDLRADDLRALLTPHSPGLRTLLAPLHPRSAGSVTPALVGRVLELLVEEVDHVVVDTSTSLDALALAAMDRSEAVVLLATLEIPALKHLARTLETLEELGHPSQRWKVVVNRADSRVGVDVREVERTLGRPVSARVPSSLDVPGSVNRGVPLVLESPTHPVSRAVVGFAERELVGPGSPRVVDLRRDGPATARTDGPRGPGRGVTAARP